MKFIQIYLGVAEIIPKLKYSKDTPFIVSDDYTSVTNEIKKTLTSKFEQSNYEF